MTEDQIYEEIRRRKEQQLKKADNRITIGIFILVAFFSLILLAK